jgi:hypothetical protein
MSAAVGGYPGRRVRRRCGHLLRHRRCRRRPVQVQAPVWGAAAPGSSFPGLRWSRGVAVPTWTRRRPRSRSPSPSGRRLRPSQQRCRRWPMQSSYAATTAGSSLPTTWSAIPSATPSTRWNGCGCISCSPERSSPVRRRPVNGPVTWPVPATGQRQRGPTRSPSGNGSTTSTSARPSGSPKPGWPWTLRTPLAPTCSKCGPKHGPGPGTCTARARTSGRLSPWPAPPPHSPDCSPGWPSSPPGRTT